MRILVDDRECPSPATTIAQAIHAASDAAERLGRSVVDVFVDGEEWSERELNDPQRLACDAVEVRCVTTCPGALLRETFLQAAESLVEAERHMRAAAQLLQADDSKAGMTTLLEGLSVWMDIQKATAQGTEFGGIDPNTVVTPEGSLEDAVRSLNALLVALRDAVTGNDTVAASDCLLYEFPPVVRRWALVLGELARRSDELRAR